MLRIAPGARHFPGAGPRQLFVVARGGFNAAEKDPASSAQSASSVCTPLFLMPGTQAAEHKKLRVPRTRNPEHPEHPNTSADLERHLIARPGRRRSRLTGALLGRRRA